MVVVVVILLPLMEPLGDQFSNRVKMLPADRAHNDAVVLVHHTYKYTPMHANVRNLSPKFKNQCRQTTKNSSYRCDADLGLTV